MESGHIYDSDGQQLCCTQIDKIYTAAGAEDLLSSRENKDSNAYGHLHMDDDGHDHVHDGIIGFRIFLPSIISFVLLLVAIMIDYIWKPVWFTGWIRLIYYLVPYAIVGFPVIRDAVRSVRKKEIFSEFFLMTIATIGAFAIGEYPEGVAVMLFYAIGEVFQTMAVAKAKSNISTLIDQRPDVVIAIIDETQHLIYAKEVPIGTIIQIKPGEKLALDGIMISDKGAFDTSILTGESKPSTKYKDDQVLAGMINLNTAIRVRTNTLYSNSKLSKVLELVQNATSQKAPTELFIRRFAKIYTPIVVFLALSICLLPYFFVKEYLFNEWLYKALVFLVISCPCALVISIPLGYFGGIGAASRNGILFKGSNFLDVLADIDHVVMDKTGTLTEGVFEVQEVAFDNAYNRDEILSWVNALESLSTHPVASAIHKYVGPKHQKVEILKGEELPGFGLKGEVNGKEILVGNLKLLENFGIHLSSDLRDIPYTTIYVAYDQQYVGYITIADTIKSDSLIAIRELKELGVKVTMLSGDNSAVVNYVAKQLGLDCAYGDLLPEDKVIKIKEIKSRQERVAFVGDGVNDAPVVALSDVGIAMGGLGSDTTIEAADVIIQDDMPSRIPMAIRIGKQTKKIVWQNITLAFVVKLIVLILGAGGIATMWEAVFADVGVSLLAILNAVRIQRMQF